MALQKTDLNENWRVKYEFEAEDKKSSQSKILANVHLPEFWFDFPPFKKIIYSKTVTIKESGSFTYLYFDRLEAKYEIKINNQTVIENDGQIANYYLEITDYITDKKNYEIQIQIYPDGLDGRIMGTIQLLTSGQEIAPATPYHAKSALPQPDWLAESVIYELYIRAFSKSGKISKVTQKLDYLQDLGVNCIWLMPLFPIGEELKKGALGCPYAIQDYKAINPRLGSQRALKKLVKKSHAKDMKVILDMVCNHTAWDNILLEQHPSWFTKNEKGEIIQPQGTDWFDVADLDYSNPEVQEYMLEVLKFWIKEYDLDGFRMDVAEFIPLDFWQKALQELQKIKSNILFLAEGDHPELHATAFHLSYAWNTRLSSLRILKYDQSAEAFQKVVEHELSIYPQNSLKMRFTENHDLARSHDILARPASQVAALLNFTLPGVPMLYNGQEIGAERRLSLFDEDTIEWDKKDADIFAFYKKLITIHKENPILTKGSIEFLDHDKKQNVVAFLRYENRASLLIIANTCEQSIDIELNNIEQVNKAHIEKLIGCSEITVPSEKKLSLHLPSYGYGIYILK